MFSRTGHRMRCQKSWVLKYALLCNLDTQHHPSVLGFSFQNYEMNSGQGDFEDAFHCDAHQSHHLFIPWCRSECPSFTFAGCGSDGGRKLRQAFRNNYPDFPCGSAGKESARNEGDLGSIPGLGRSSGEGKGYPLQYSGLEKSMDCIIHGVTKSQTQLSDFHSLTHPALDCLLGSSRL